MKCKKCDGKGLHEFSRETSFYYMEWMGDEGPMEYCEKTCFYCEGKGELSKTQLKEKMKIKSILPLAQDPTMKFFGTAFGEDIYEKEGKRYTEKNNRIVEIKF